MQKINVGDAHSLTGALNCTKIKKTLCLRETATAIEKGTDDIRNTSKCQGTRISGVPTPNRDPTESRDKTLQAAVKACHKKSAEKIHEYLLDQANIANDNDDHARGTVLKQIRIIIIISI